MLFKNEFNAYNFLNLNFVNLGILEWNRILNQTENPKAVLILSFPTTH